MMYTANDHTFAIIAYKENKYLEKTILSVLNQTVKTNIILSTSTPNDHILGLCDKYNIKYVINPNSKGAGSDWNYGYNACVTPLVTIVHQDDIYDDDFAETTLKYANRSSDLILLFTDYYEIREENAVSNQKLLKIKQIMNHLIQYKFMWKNRAYRKFILALGDSISCPTVTINKDKMGKDIFDTTLKNSCDYLTWVLMAKSKGEFIYIPKQIVGHRIYPESATSLNIADSSRSKDDLQIMMMLWPRWLAKIIHHFYVKSEESNKI
ncbi:MAG: glycosyltransferase [Bacilli bacterium]|uniref:glycosyltransferase n=1 Tax=Anaerorhabdus sp. TaxID=1872524 RepID=UPI002FC7BF15